MTVYLFSQNSSPALITTCCDRLSTLAATPQYVSRSDEFCVRVKGAVCSVIEGFTKQTKIAGACLHVCIHIQTQIDGYRHSRMYTHTHAYTHIHVHKQKLAANKFYQEYTYR